ncbi:hypothetical protein VCR17J2_90139 [Vibrio coralliirubri]|nr:hypothetical protein VCR17J2_90139 [Vibrio coralliirubri]
MKTIDKRNTEELITFLSNLNDYSYQFDSINTKNISDVASLYTGIQHQHGVILVNNSMLIINSSFMEEWQVSSLIEWLNRNDLLSNIIAANFTLVSLKQLVLFPNLKHLTFSGKIDSIAPLKLKSLESLNYEGNDLARLLECFSEQTNKIKYLELASNTLDIKTINKMVNLEDLAITKFDGDFSEHEKLNLPNLSSFSCFNDFNISHLESCPNISNVNGTLNTELDFSHLANNLKRVSVGRSLNLHLDNLYLNNLEAVHFYSNGSLADITKSIPSLKYLSIYSSPSQSARQTREFKLSNLALLENIEQLMMRAIDIVDDTDNDFFHEHLKGFDLAHSNINDLTFITKLHNIERLSLPNCKIENIEPLINMERLTQVYLKNNRIIYIPPELSKKFNIIPNQNSELSPFIAIGNNPLISPPIEIVDRGEKAVRPYFNSMVGDMEELNEAKIIFLGNGEVGKTSLMKALSGQDFDSDEATTHGINICKYNVPINETRSIDAAIWDFGGQQIMHATHQLFLSRRCVYVLVINDRRDDLQQEQKIEYWLQQVQTFGGDSKIIIIRNKYDMFSLNNVPEGKLKSKFPNLVAIESVSCKTGYNLARVRNMLNEQVRQLPMRKVCLAKNWIKIKEEIKALSYEKDHLPLSTFTDICVNNGVIDNEAQNTLRNLLHDLSVIIAFEELSDFNMGILNPHWITDGIYTVINSDVLEGSNGYIKVSEVQNELDRVHPGKYGNKARFIIESMLQFELCHSIGSSRSNTYLVPNLLPNEVKDIELVRGVNTIHFLFKYEKLLPPSLFPKLLVRMSHQIAADKRWRSGAVLKDVDLNAQARIEVDSVEKEIKVIVTGTQARDYFAVLRHTIRNLHNPSAQALGVKELVPLDYSNEYVDYEELIGLEVMGQTDYISGRLKESYPVLRLLSGIESRAETEKSVARQKEEINVSVEVKTGDVNVRTGDITNSLSSSSEQLQTVSQTQQVDLQIELKGLSGTAEYVLNDLKDEADFEIENERDKARFIKECDKVKEAITQIEQADTPEKANNNLGSFSRVQDFLSNALEGTGKVGETMQSLGDNISKVRELAKKYNKVASLLGLPVVPEILL